MPNFDKIAITKKVLSVAIAWGAAEIIFGIVEHNTDDRDRIDQKVSIEIAKYGTVYVVKELIEDRVDASVDKAYASWLDFKQEVKDKMKEKGK
jgi:hypothetical protein